MKSENSVDMTKVLFIVLPSLIKPETIEKDTKIRKFKAFPYGLLSVASYINKMRSDSTQIQILDCNTIDNPTSFLDHIRNKLEEFQPDITGLSMMFDNSYKHLQKTIDEIKAAARNSIVVLGGTSATSSFKAILEQVRNLDGICYSEGEIPFLGLIDSTDRLGFLESNGSWITSQSLGKGKTPHPSLVTDLDAVVSVNYDLIHVPDYGMEESFSPYAKDGIKQNQFFLITSRGCPFKCVFCGRSLDENKSMRYASVTKTIEHVKHLVDHYKMNILTIYDDQLLYDRDRAKELFRKLAGFDLRIECPNGLSVAFIDDELAELMRKAGLDTVYLAIESGSPYVLKQLIHKPLNLKKVTPVIQILRKHNFWIQGYFVNGMPGETDEHRAETVAFIKDIGLDWSGFTLAIPSRGSKLYEICIEKGYIKKDIGIDEIDPTKYIINTPEYTTEHVTKASYLMNLDVNFVNNYRMEHGDYAVAAACFKSVTARYPDHAFAYYFLAKALTKLNETNQAEAAMTKTKEIVNRDGLWKEYFNYFNCPL